MQVPIHKATSQPNQLNEAREGSASRALRAEDRHRRGGPVYFPCGRFPPSSTLFFCFSFSLLVRCSMLMVTHTKHGKIACGALQTSTHGRETLCPAFRRLNFAARPLCSLGWFSSLRKGCVGPRRPSCLLGDSVTPQHMPVSSSFLLIRPPPPPVLFLYLHIIPHAFL